MRGFVLRRPHTFGVLIYTVNFDNWKTCAILNLSGKGPHYEKNRVDYVGHLVFGHDKQSHRPVPLSYLGTTLTVPQPLRGHMPWEVTNGGAAFQYHASQYINARIILPFADPSQLSGFLQDVYNPKSAEFHHFLTPEQFAHGLLPPMLDSLFVQEFLKNEGISVNGQSANGTVLKVTGPISSFEHAFRLHINYYKKKSNGKMFYAPDADPTLPAPLADKVLAVGGLDDFAKYKPYSQRYLRN